MDIFDTDIRFPQTALSLLKRLQTKQLTFQEFMTECAYWTLKDGFNSLMPYRLPQKPQSVIDLELMPREKRARLDDKYYRERPEIMKYVDVVFVLRNKNKANFDWLLQIKKYIPTNDIESHKKLDARILMFQIEGNAPSRRIDPQTKEALAVFQPQGAEEVGDDIYRN